MASRRNLKKSINNLTGTLLNECFAFSFFHPGTRPTQVNNTLWALAHTRNELISRINRHRSPVDPDASDVRAFYRTLRTDIARMPALMNEITGEL